MHFARHYGKTPIAISVCLVAVLTFRSTISSKSTVENVISNPPQTTSNPPSAPAPPSPASTMSTPPSSKRGLSWPWDNPASHFPLYTPAITTGKLSWLFNWELWRPDGLPAGLQYIPCVRTAKEAPQIDQFLSSLPSPVPYFLGFNEPDIADQANLTVDEAVRLWREFVLPAKKKYGFRLGSPGISSAPAGKQWLREFLDKMHGEDGVDFIVLHWYGTDFAAFASYLGEMSTWGRRLWVNEFAFSRFGGAVREEEVEGFVRQAVEWLDGWDAVERYAFFGAMRDVGEWAGRANGFVKREEGEGEGLTGVGRLYCEL